MSRSKRKTPILGITKAESEKKDKQSASRKFRRKTRQALPNGRQLPGSLNDVSNPWTFAKDGKQYLRENIKEYMRK